MHKATGFCAACLVSLLAVLPAAAQTGGLRLCNQSFDVLNVAVAVPRQDGGPAERTQATRGWWRVAPYQCATILPEPLGTGPYHLFAADVFGREALGGTIPMCVAPRRFEITGHQDCLLRGYLDARFMAVETGGEAAWTVFVAPRPG